MFSLLSECRLWTGSGDVKIKSTDFGAFRYHDKKEHAETGDSGEVDQRVHLEAKRSYSEARSHKFQLDNKKPAKLKNSIRKLEELLKEYSVVYCQWKDNVVMRLVLSNGLLIHICINALNGDILRIAFDKFFLGKIVSDTITDVVITKMHIIIAYNQNQITFVHLQKPSLKRFVPEKVTRMEPKIFNIIVGGPQGRKLPRQIACNNSCDLIAIWTRSSQNEVYPWRPTIRDQDRANVHIYKITRSKFEPVCFHWTENDPICVEFVRLNQNQLRIVEQRITRKGEVFIEDQIYDVSKTKMQRNGVTSIPLQTQVSCYCYSPDQEKLMLGCIDGSIVLFDEHRGITHLVKAGFIPTMISWHCDSALILVANEHCQIQCFDISLACVKGQLISEDITPSSLIDLSTYFAYQPTLNRILWNRKPELHLNHEKYAQLDSFVLLLFESGPIGCLRMFGGCGLKGDIHTSGFTVDVLIHNYLTGNQVEKAINLLLCLNWDTYGAMCLSSLHKIVNFIFRNHLTIDREAQLQKALGSFHAPVKPLSEDTENEFGDQVRDIMRKFFQYLLRFRAFEKAFTLGIDINDDDLFMDLYNAARLENNESMAEDAFKKAQEILRHSGDNHSTCSHSSCSACLTENSVSSSLENIPETVSTRPDLIECSADEKTRIFNHPPLPKPTSTTTFREQSYIPPLPFTKKPPNQAPNRIFIPKPQLTVSHSHHKPLARHRIAYNETNRLLLTDPPLPIPRSLNELDQVEMFDEDLDEIDFLYDQQQKLPKKANTRTLNHIEPASRSIFPTLATGPSTSVFSPSEHMVIDIFPKPGGDPEESKPDFLDQTIGIPFENVPLPPKPVLVPGVMKTSLPRHPISNPAFYPIAHHYPAPEFQPLQSSPGSMYNKTEKRLPGQQPTVVHQYPLISGQIPPAASTAPQLPLKLGPFESPPKINAAHVTGRATVSFNSDQMVQSSALSSSSGSGNGNRAIGEKNKVKFSDTITVAVVPEIPRKPGGDSRLKRSQNHPMMDTQKELADSLPLCHPNEEYLKDFQPISDKQDEKDGGRGPSTIKVIHFGVV